MHPAFKVFGVWFSLVSLLKLASPTFWIIPKVVENALQNFMSEFNLHWYGKIGECEMINWSLLRCWKVLMDGANPLLLAHVCPDDYFVLIPETSCLYDWGVVFGISLCMTLFSCAGGELLMFYKAKAGQGDENPEIDEKRLCLICDYEVDADQCVVCANTKAVCCMVCFESVIYMCEPGREVVGTARLPECFCGCDKRFSLAELGSILPPKTYDHVCRDLTRAYLARRPDVVWCRCGTAYSDRNKAMTFKRCIVKCMGCPHRVCFGCGETLTIKQSKQHNREGCRQFQRSRHGKPLKGTQECPTCHATIDRKFGCNAMRCTYCNEPFKWR